MTDENKSPQNGTVQNNSDEIWIEESWHAKQGHGLRIRAEKKLFEVQSPFQFLEVYETSYFGRILILDGIIQLTEFDEFAYHEMGVHVPAACMADPQTALVIGGGDGGMVRELVKYPSLKKIVLCDIDEEVTVASRRFFPSLASGLDDPRVEVLHSDGFAYLKETTERFDIVVTDSTDPVGPAVKLFEPAFFELVGGVLTERGVAVSQCESIWFEGPLITQKMKELAEIFKYRGYYKTLVPTYPSGMIGFAVYSKGSDPNNLAALHDHAPADCRYYSLEAHRAAFGLPVFARKYAPLSD